VREEVEDDLLPHLTVYNRRPRQGWAIDEQSHSCSLDGRAEHADQFGGEGGEVRRLAIGLDAAGPASGGLEQGGDEPGQGRAVGVGDGEPLSVHGRQRAAGPGEDVFKRGEQERKRGAEFVADVREECGLRRVELSQGFRTTPLLCERPGACDRGRYLARYQIE